MEETTPSCIHCKSNDTFRHDDHFVCKSCGRSFRRRRPMSAATQAHMLVNMANFLYFHDEAEGGDRTLARAQELRARLADAQKPRKEAILAIERAVKLSAKGDASGAAGNYRRAKKFLEPLYEELHLPEDLERLLGCCEDLARTLEKKGDPEAAEEEYAHLVELCGIDFEGPTRKDCLRLAKYLRVYAEFLSRQNSLERVSPLYEKAIRLLEEQVWKDNNGEARCDLAIALLNYSNVLFSLKRHSEGRRLLEISIVLFEELLRAEDSAVNLYLLLFAQTNLAIRLYLQSDWSGAAAIFRKTLPQVERLIRLRNSPWDQALQARHANYYGNTLQKLGELSAAEPHLFHAVELLEKLTQTRSDPDDTLNLACARTDLANLQKALEAQRAAEQKALAEQQAAGQKASANPRPTRRCPTILEFLRWLFTDYEG